MRILQYFFKKNNISPPDRITILETRADWIVPQIQYELQNIYPDAKMTSIKSSQRIEKADLLVIPYRKGSISNIGNIARLVLKNTSIFRTKTLLLYGIDHRDITLLPSRRIVLWLIRGMLERRVTLRVGRQNMMDENIFLPEEDPWL